MIGFFEAYGLRMTRNHDQLIGLAQEMKERGHTVYLPRKKHINFFVVVKEKKQGTVGFEEVPYRWSIHVSHKPNKEHGSGRCVNQMFTDKTYTPEQVEKNMVDYNGNIEKYKESRLWFLTEL